ncbi:MAG: FAD-binding protein [Bacteroides sp.]|uniref:FAD-binding protein n=1 Tax=Bacteroides sp. TaxID=29523 RepID=UPI0026E11189|nr:FAD-binding protein [Bacteroides sp.]MDO5420579.1 FAD-binding protein [Bacteroides sp.]
MIIDFLNSHSIFYGVNVSLKTKTWIKTGGVAALWIMPRSLQQLIDITLFLYKNRLSFEIVGNMSNLYFYDSYHPEIVISTLKLCNYRETATSIECECGTNVAKLSRYCVENGVSGFYGLVNLPGTVAAAVYNNAGCYNCSVADRLETVKFLSFDEGGKIISLNKEQLKFTHRSSALKKKELHGIILSVQLKKEKAIQETERKKAEIVAQRRKQTQEAPQKNLGSIYSNLKYKKNIRNILARTVKIISRYLHIGNNGILPYKKIQLFFYGFQYLDQYISDKNINTFIWKDNNATEMFTHYQTFMNKIYDSPTLEIEIKK